MPRKQRQRGECLVCPSCGSAALEPGVEGTPPGLMFCLDCKEYGKPERLAVPDAYGQPEEGTCERTLIFTTLDRIQREEVTWLWKDRIPVGRLTGIAGDPGVGKSWLTLSIATAVTLGAPVFGDTQEREPARVLLLTAEDGLADTVRARMEDMGADLSRVTVLESVQGKDGNETILSLTEDLARLEAELMRGDYGLVVIDPLNAYIGGNVNTNNDAALRSVLMPLAALAERRRVAVVFVAHFNKAQTTRAIYRINGSIGYVGAARVVHIVGKHPDRPGERVLVTVKNNLAPELPALAYEIREGRFAWLGESEVGIAAIVGADPDADEQSALDEAIDFLKEELADGPRPCREVEEAAKSRGISTITLRRARSRLGVRTDQPGKQGERGRGPASWWLPDDLPAQSNKKSSQIGFVSESGDPELLREQSNTADDQADHPCNNGHAPKLGPLAQFALKKPGVRLVDSAS